ncbi:MAG TPA: ATP-binding protein [Gemmatimonadaceae bacterium]|nr:ATP-binding protein [Gemmatimonadaceae bacterium]
MAGDREPPHRRLSGERSIVILLTVSALPAALVALDALWRWPYALEVRWTLATAIVVTWLVCAAMAYHRVVSPLQVIANLLGALREGDYAIRGLATSRSSALGLVMHEVNTLGETLQRQRLSAVESSALLASVMNEIDVAIYAFDRDEQLRLVNPAGERLVGERAERMLGRSAESLGFADYLRGETPRMVERGFAGGTARWELRRSHFRRDGLPHTLLVFADISLTLRQQEQQAWQRIVRVLSHEINNSLAPIKSMAHSVRRIVEREMPESPRSGEVRQALTTIATRSDALGRFMASYARLARLPKPSRGAVRLRALLQRVARLDERIPVVVNPGPDVTLQADADQLEQLLINLVQNAVDASLESGGTVSLTARVDGRWVEIAVEDEGPGVADATSLFVPFFTTKPNGSGIGLALSRQIAEAHGGTIALGNRPGRRGASARVRLPL